MESWETSERVKRGAAWAAALGALAGMTELVGLLATLTLPLGPLDVVTLGLTLALVMATVGGGLGLLAGIVHLARPEAPAHRNLAWQLAIPAGLLACLYLVPFGQTLVADGRPGAAGAILMMAVGVAGTVLFNARYWLARLELGKPAPVGWMVASGTGVSAVVVVAAVAFPLRDTGGAGALDDDPNVLVITVHGWDDADDSAVLAGLASRGVQFTQTISPATSVVAANGAWLTGLHPLRHRALHDGWRVPSPIRTVPERFDEEGFATAAFVSTAALGSHTGLAQGFRVYDDAIGPLPAGLDRSQVARWMLATLGPGSVSRPGDHTARAFSAWLDDHAGVPWMAWVQLDGTDQVEASMEALLGAVAAHDLTETTAVVLAGTAGGTRGSSSPIAESRVHVPLVMALPGRDTSIREVGALVRLMDVGPTLLRYATLEVGDQVEGVDLLGYLDGTRSADLWASLVGRTTRGTWALGVRTAEVAYHHDLESGEEDLFDMVTDPEAKVDLAAEQEGTVKQARTMLAGEHAALERRLSEGPTHEALVDARLHALGYR